MPLRLLAALNRFACHEDAARPHLAGVAVLQDELAATDGHHMVRIPLDHGAFIGSEKLHEGAARATYLIPSRLIRAAAGAAHEAGLSIRSQPISINYGKHGADCHMLINNLTLAMRAGTDSFPPIDQAMITTTDGEPMPGWRCNPRYLADIHEVLEAGGSADWGIACTGWGKALDPMQFESFRIRFVIMPMRQPEVGYDAGRSGGES
jgi:hypothetical protein